MSKRELGSSRFRVDRLRNNGGVPSVRNGIERIQFGHEDERAGVQDDAH
jgi:hypothetical protein